MTSSIAHTDRIRYANANDVFAASKDDASISGEEFPGGDMAKACKRAEDSVRNDGDSALVLSIVNDAVGRTARDTLWFHPDEDARLEIIDRARQALDNAEAALLAVGYTDRVHLRTEDYKPAPQRERNGFELGRDDERSQQPA